ncbi:MAG: hypothetical protein AAGA31_20065 [Bacteroidota bacterium]
MKGYSFILILLLGCCTTSLFAQGKAKTIQLEKGQVLDILLLNDAGNDAAKQKYFKEAYPVAQKHGYQPGAGWAVKEIPFQGNQHPELFVTGSWPSVAARRAGLSALEKEVDDFHGQRRTVWTNFQITYFELPEAVAITTDPAKYYVATMFWSAAEQPFGQFLEKWEKQQKQHGGTPLLTLTEGTSPFGYHHNPDYLTITEWPDEATFRTFLEKDRAADHTGVNHLSQFRIN